MLTIEDVANKLNISTKSVWRLIVRVGNLVRVDEKDLEDYINKNRVTRRAG